MSHLRVVAIVQARMSATRLPGKVMADIAGNPMLWHVVERVRMAPSIDEVVVATSTMPVDDAIAEYCLRNKIPCERGSETDVLDRFYQTARRHVADVVVRVTADCPFIDPGVIERVVVTYFGGGCDYVTNTLRCTYPDGQDTEVFSLAALETAWRNASAPADREHVTTYLRTSGRFRMKNVESDLHSSLPIRDVRLTVDERADLEFVRALHARLAAVQALPTLTNVLRLIEREDSLMKMNSGIVRNEGYYRSLASEPPVPVRVRSLRRSDELTARATRVIPSCTQTFSKAPTQFVRGVAPTFLARAQGSHVWDVDGNEYIDYPMALGPVILGHNYPRITDAVTRQMADGVAFSLPHPLEVDVAEMLTEIIPCADMVRFGKNGSDATSGAVRAARAYTGRETIACCGYHGWQDWYIGTTTRNKGVPEAVRRLTVPFEYNNLESLERVFAEHPGQVAGVILEPIGVVEPGPNFLQQVRELATREGALLIFDEIITGFRLALGGAQEYFGVTPDLACFGKGMANGFPIAAIVGRREVMQIFDEVFFSFTFGGETLSLAAAFATITEMRSKDIVSYLWEQGKKLQDGYGVLAKQFGLERYTVCIGLPPRTVIAFRDKMGEESLLLKSLFQQECLKRGVLFSGGQNLSYSHSDADVEYTLRVYRTAMEVLADALEAEDVERRLEGDPVEPVFRRA